MAGDVLRRAVHGRRVDHAAARSEEGTHHLTQASRATGSLPTLNVIQVSRPTAGMTSLLEGILRVMGWSGWACPVDGSPNAAPAASSASTLRRSGLIVAWLSSELSAWVRELRLRTKAKACDEKDCRTGQKQTKSGILVNGVAVRPSRRCNVAGRRKRKSPLMIPSMSKSSARFTSVGLPGCDSESFRAAYFRYVSCMHVVCGRLRPAIF